MNYISHSFRHAQVILQEPKFINQYNELNAILDSITDSQIIEKHLSYGYKNIEKTPKSISKAINDLLKERFTKNNWLSESGIFQDNQYTGDTWRLDFAKKDISVEVAFNHATVIAWNLIKPVLASELNHVQKAIQTRIGVIITATNDMKQLGGFDSAIGTYEKFLDYLPPLRNLLTVPLLVIGLTPPETFRIEHKQIAPRKKIGRIIRFGNDLFS
ncbi:BglII/BstYI family type II restriction endonuclease [Winogradskyella sp.]|uniref:BglII/BstYI family type II restriction endonuclease n=1 Tax=Winogradskyella sp. TaxID=1883156 RepID=UPI00261195B4|nr:BglII/BstYI family type II restriction endonuclease [Winogradskyella sp.]